jgi:hypothetical protein
VLPIFSDQPPEPDLTDFDRITSQIPMVSPFRALWNEAEELLLETHPDGFEPEQIGRIAFDCLPEQEREQALDELFYTYWAETVSYREARAAQGGGAA